MKEIVSVTLENEMDLILAHKRTMRLAEMCGLSVTTQTVLATAVSEIARCALMNGKDARLVLGVTSLKGNKKQISAAVRNAANVCRDNSEAFRFAKRLIDEVQITDTKKGVDIVLNHNVKLSGLITESKVESFVNYFRTEPPVSAYDELRRKNIQLIDFSQKLQESENQYRLLTDNLPLMMFSLKFTGEVAFINQGVKDYFGTSLQMTLPLPWQKILHADDYSSIIHEWDRSTGNKSALRTQARLKSKSDQYLWHLISIVPLRNDAGLVQSWTGFFVDIQAQKQVEETLKDNRELKDTQRKLVEYQRKLEEKVTELNMSNHELEQFAYIASHDLQEPLRKIITFSALLEERLKDLDGESKLYFNKIISSSRRMTSLINDVLDYSRLSKTTDEFIPVDLNELLQIITADFEVVMQQKNAVIELRNLPVVTGIPLQLSQLFSNLISNALKFCEQEPRITIIGQRLPVDKLSEMHQLDADTEYTEILVKDNGIGFEQQYAEQIFTIFQRLNGRTAYSGTGIGLAICRKIVDNHRGHIMAQSQAGEGATFRIYLPLSGALATTPEAV